MSAETAGHVGPDRDDASHVARNRDHWNTALAPVFGRLAPGQWSRPEPAWGHWSVPESELRLLPGDLGGRSAVELGCGTAYVSSWLARAGARPVGVDVSAAQFATARAMQARFGVGFPLVLADAERLPFPDAVFDFAVSELGAALWCDPYRWIAEAARVLAPGGRLSFLTMSPLFSMCVPDDGPAGPALTRPQFGPHRRDWGDSVEFALPHGAMLRLLRSCGLEVEDMVEVRAPERPARDYDYLPAAWARRWPGEEVWKVRKRGRGA
ncbi:class I SAM-dependent methyltransferase [Streptomonospora nanhaiensis]|uniref:SAM-dependent methyltransferase n=1 Tax=Streptomonospora nanhaiensis TaxID=1323731 RepID=A0A853BR01_9ACTN|nr:class I SAM-dependent methyltransferase [Streptomonospora nanhaiensis]MBV2365817.1 class I SAM-dependent methyltransferase [Streptomonospora nanhaiensis]NYI98149.1 SAM-dependent methyltransferase [Streptomonospora nanhaiensis]